MIESSSEASDETGLITPLEPSLWRNLAAARSRSEVAKAWLPLQCRAIDGSQSALIVLAGDEAGTFEPVAIWPDNAGKLNDLSEAASAAITQRQAVVRTAGSKPGGGASIASTVIAFPILVDDAVHGAASILLAGPASLDPKFALRQLQWGVAWIRDALRQHKGLTDTRLLARSRAALDLLAEALENEEFQAAALAVATELALRFECTRVSIGFMHRGSIRLSIISHTAQFRRQMTLIRKIAAAMNESVDQRAVIVFPMESAKDLATMAHAELSRLQRDSRLLTVPIFKVDRFVGAFTFERPADLPFGADLLQLLEALGASLGPVLDEKRRNDRWLGAKLAEVVKRQLVRLLGPGHVIRKLAVVTIIAVVTFFYFTMSTYRVDSDARLEGLVRRAVVAPYDGFVREAGVRAGDSVVKSQVLAALDDRDLALERLRWVTERQQRLYEYDKALASRQPAAINVTRSQIDQADAQIKLIDAQLERETIRAPIDGLVVSGDLSQLIGTSVNRGQVLFEVAPLDGYRVILGVDERLIGEVKNGQRGTLVVNALPDERYAFTIDKITPIAEPHGGRNVFRVEGRLTENSARLRPGMEGVAKIEIGRRLLIWVWTRSFVDWLRLWAWQYVS